MRECSFCENTASYGGANDDIVYRKYEQKRGGEITDSMILHCWIGYVDEKEVESPRGSGNFIENKLYGEPVLKIKVGKSYGDCDIYNGYISYCPMCGRKLEKINY